MSLDGAAFVVTAPAGVVPEGATLKVKAFDSEAIAPAVEAAVGEEDIYTHRSYRVELVDGENRVILPNLAQGAVDVRVEGLELPDGTRVAVYDATLNGAYEIDASVKKGDLAFELADMGVYDFFTIEPPTAAQEEAPAEAEAEKPVEASIEGEVEEPAGQSAEGTADVPEGAAGVPEKAPEAVLPDLVEEAEQTVELVGVAFDTVPEAAVVTVFDANGEAIPAQEDGCFLLCPGEYAYSAGAEGHASLENVPFTVSDEPMTILVALEAEAAAFEQSQTVNGVVVTVKAEPGVFPANAELSVKRVPTYKVRQAEAAIEGHEELAGQIAETMNNAMFTPYYAKAEGNVVHFSVLKAQSRNNAVSLVQDVLKACGIDMYSREGQRRSPTR